MKLLSLILIFGITSAAGAAQGLPLPWPFPWAKDCAIEWQDMEGRYMLSDSRQAAEIDLKISVVAKAGFKLVRLSRYDRDGKLVADGFNFVSENQRTLRLFLIPMNKQDKPSWAIIKLHYQSSAFSCAQDQLVPILTLETIDTDNPTPQQPVQYRLIRRDPH